MMLDVAKNCPKSASSRLPDVPFFMRNWLFGENLAILLQKCDPKVMAIFQSKSWHFFCKSGQKVAERGFKMWPFHEKHGAANKKAILCMKNWPVFAAVIQIQLENCQKMLKLCVKRN